MMKSLYWPNIDLELLRIAPRLYAPIAVAVMHFVIPGICVGYIPSLLEFFPTRRGLATLTLLLSTLYVLARCCLADPGLVSFGQRLDKDEFELETGGQLPGKLSLPIQSRRDVELNGRGPIEKVGATACVLRHCHICDSTQPLRSKHCEDCNRCVRTYDHHCPWIGTCVGEGTRAWFLLYLILEFLTLAWFGGTGLAEISAHAGERSKLGSFAGLISAITIISIFLVMTGILSGYHFFLCISNLTTWEHSSWRKITYLKDLRPELGSPFAQPGWVANLKMFLGLGVDRDDGGGILWRMGPQHSILPKACRYCCDI